MREKVSTRLRSLAFGMLCVLVPAVLLQAEPSHQNYFTVIPPLDIRDFEQDGTSSLTQDRIAGSILPTTQIHQAQTRARLPWAASGVLSDSQAFFPILGFFELGSLSSGLDRFFVRYGMARFQDFTLGGALWQPSFFLYTHVALGYGLGAKKSARKGEDQYSVSVLMGLTSRYTEKNGLSSREFAATKDHLLYFTPGMEFMGKTLSIEASLELPIARITPETEDIYSRQVRANIGMKYRLK